MNTVNESIQSETSEMLKVSLKKQRQSYLADPTPDYK